MRYANSFWWAFLRAQRFLRTNWEMKFHSLQRLGALQHGVGVAFHPHLAPQLGELTVAAEQEGRPFDPHIGAAVILFLDPGAERLAHRAILVGGEANGQTVFVAELAELRRRIARYRQHLCVQMREFGREAREILRLGRAARRIGLGIEIDAQRSEGHTSEITDIMRHSYAVR